ncbi:MAG: hypothetical protein ACK56F_17075 [bacterium]
MALKKLLERRPFLTGGGRSCGKPCIGRQSEKGCKARKAKGKKGQKSYAQSWISIGGLRPASSHNQGPRPRGAFPSPG